MIIIWLVLTYFCSLESFGSFTFTFFSFSILHIFSPVWVICWILIHEGEGVSFGWFVKYPKTWKIASKCCAYIAQVANVAYIEFRIFCCTFTFLLRFRCTCITKAKTNREIFQNDVPFWSVFPQFALQIVIFQIKLKNELLTLFQSQALE